MTLTDTNFEAEPDAAPAVLYRLAGVTRTYTGKGRAVTALDGVDLDIHEGDFVTKIGRAHV